MTPAVAGSEFIFSTQNGCRPFAIHKAALGLKHLAGECCGQSFSCKARKHQPILANFHSDFPRTTTRYTAKFCLCMLCGSYSVGKEGGKYIPPTPQAHRIRTITQGMQNNTAKHTRERQMQPNFYPSLCRDDGLWFLL